MYPNQMNPQQQQGGFGFDVNQYEAQVPMENLPIGWYNVLISEAEMEPLQSGKGTCCKNVYTVFGGPFEGRKLFDNLNVIHENEQAQDIARRQLRTIQDSIGKPVQGPWDLINNYMCVKVGLSKPKKDATPDEKTAHEPRNEIKGYKPFDAALHAQNQQPAPQGYAVQVQPMGNGAPMQQQPMPQQFAQQSMPPQMQPQMQPQGQVPQPQQFQQQMPPQQQQQQMPPQQQQVQQQVQPQQQYAQQPNNVPQQGNAPGSQQMPMNGQQGQAQNAPDATGQAGQQSQGQAEPNAQQQVAPQQTFAPQPGQQQAPQNIPNPPQAQQQVAPNPQYAPQQQQQQMPQQPQQPQSGTVPPPPGNGGAW